MLELKLCTYALMGSVQAQGRQHCLFMDSKSLVCASRSDLQPHKKPFAHDLPFQRTLLDAIHEFKPTALIGVSTSRGAFSQDVIQVCGLFPLPLSSSLGTWILL